MFELLTYWDIALAAATAVLALSEVATLVVARQRGLTRNVSRLVTHGAIGLLMFATAGLGWSWLQSYRSLATLTDFNNAPIFNWSYILLGVAIGVLVSFEIVAHLRAISGGLTKNVSRLAVRIVMLVLLMLMVSINMEKWNQFLDHFEESSAAAYPSRVP
jgi:uncharacterized protein YacL